MHVLFHYNCIKLRVIDAVRNFFSVYNNIHALSLSTKLKLCKTLAWPVTTYRCESWTLRQTEIKKLEAYEMKMIRKVLRIPWTAHHTNESVLQEAGYHRQFLGTIKQRKLKYLGHVMRKEGENLEKTVIQGSVPGKRERGRPGKHG